MVTTLGPTVAGVAIAGGRWALDPYHSAITFTIRHLGLSKVRGRFERFDATLEVGDTPEATRVRATVDMASVNTGQRDRDAHLRATDFFNVEQHPTLQFVSTAISGDSEEWQMTGEVTLNGRTNPITLAVEFNGAEIFPATGKRHIGFSATGKLRRSQYGIEFGLMPLGADKLALGDEVQIELEMQFIAPDEQE